MIARKENGVLRIKAAFNLEGEQYKLEKEGFILKDHGLIVEIEMMKVVNKDLISLEIFATGLRDINTHKKFITSKQDLCVGDGKIMRKDLEDIYYNKTINKQLVSSIIADVMVAYNPDFFIDERNII